MTTLTPQAVALLAHLTRSGSHGYYWSASEAKDDHGALEKTTYWWSVEKPARVPPDHGPHGARHLYFGVHPTTGIPSVRTTRKGETYTPKPAKCRPLLDEIAAINCLFGEFDAKRFIDGKVGALAHIGALALAPSVVIDSGGGYHCYWLLDTPYILADDAARIYARKLQYAWVVLVGSDDDAKDLSRVLRIPGTYNYKEGYGPDYPLVDWEFCDLSLTYVITDLEDVARPYISEGADRRQRSENDHDPLSEYERVEDALQRIGADRWASYQGWIDIGMALASWDSGYNGLSLWDRYSRLKAPDKWEMGICEAKWQTFNPKDITVASIFHWAGEDSPYIKIDTGVRGAQPKLEAEADHDEIPILLRASDLDKIPPAIPIVPDVFFVNTLHQMFGSPGSGKSLIALDIACTTSQLYPVVYVAAEAIEDYEARVNAWRAHHGRPVENLYFWREPLRLGSEQAVHRFIDLVSPLRPGMIILDPLADCMIGLDESSQDDMGLAIYAMNTIRRHTRAAVNIVHHTGWNDERERGSSLLRAACRIVIKIEMRDDGLIRFSCIKKNQGEKFAPRLFRLVAAGEMGSVLPLPARMVMIGRITPTERMLKVLEALTTEPLKNGATHTQLVQDTQIPAGTLNRVLTALIHAGYIRMDEEGRSRKYKMTDEGQDALDMAVEETGEKWKNKPRESSSSFNWQIDENAGLAHSDASFHVFHEKQPYFHDPSTPISSASTNPSTEDMHSDAPSSTSFQSSSTQKAPSSTLPPPYIKGVVEEPGSATSGNGWHPEDAELFESEKQVPQSARGGLDWDYLRRMKATGDEIAIRRHCAMWRGDYEMVMEQLRGTE